MKYSSVLCLSKSLNFSGVDLTPSVQTKRKKKKLVDDF